MEIIQVQGDKEEPRDQMCLKGRKNAFKCGQRSQEKKGGSIKKGLLLWGTPQRKSAFYKDTKKSRESYHRLLRRKGKQGFTLGEQRVPKISGGCFGADGKTYPNEGGNAQPHGPVSKGLKKKLSKSAAAVFFLA